MNTINSDGVQSLDSDMFAEEEDYEGSVSTDEEDDADEPYSENRPLSGNAAYAAERKRRVSNKRDSVKKQKTSIRQYRLEDDYMDAANAGIRDALARYKLEQNVDATPLWGNRPLSERSISTYQKHWNGLKYFCKLIGDYESLLMLLDRATDGCPAMKPETIANFIRFNRFSPDQELIGHDDHPVKDIFGNVVLCRGGWNDPKNVEQCNTAITVLHEERGNRGQFIESCKLCLSELENGVNHGCRRHLMNPCVWRKGDPTQSEIVQNAQRLSSRAGAAYRPEGDSPLTPYELRDFGEACMSNNKLADYQLFVMVLIGCKLFLREHELAQLKIPTTNDRENVNCVDWNMSSVTPSGDVKAIAFTIMGKSDKVPVTLFLWADNEVPSMCPVRHLLVYLHLIKLKKGFLFPSYNCLQTLSNNNGIALEAVPYDYVLRRFKEVCSKVISRDGKFGTHSMRKTGYLLGVWGNGSESDIMTSARHSTVKHSVAYRRDAEIMKQIALDNELDISEVCGKFKPIFVSSLQLARSLNMLNQTSHITLPQLADDFVQRRCGFPLDAPTRTVRAIVKRAVEVESLETTKQKLDTELSDLPPHKREKIKSLVQKLVLELRYTAQTPQMPADDFELAFQPVSPSRNRTIVGNSESHRSLTLSGGTGILSDEMRQAGSTVKKRGGSNNLDDRLTIKNLKSTQEKLDVVLRLAQIIPQDHNELTEGARAFANQIRSILNCLKNHFNGSVDQFASKYPKLAPSTFKNKCSGEGGQCPDSTPNQS
ncbi:hypothetical protein MP228_004128 [Amoeboaphelidium protococcarum]|nr:hypothetical protein MP228_004128 [Amoeboaphelidium protococcarum]